MIATILLWAGVAASAYALGLSVAGRLFWPAALWGAGLVVFFAAALGRTVSRILRDVDAWSVEDD